jgi:hypothetical protein
VAAGGVRGGLRRCGPVDGALLGLRGVGVSEMGVGGGGGGGRGAVHSGGGNGRRVHGRAVQTLIVSLSHHWHWGGLKVFVFSGWEITKFHFFPDENHTIWSFIFLPWNSFFFLFFVAEQPNERGNICASAEEGAL